MNQVHLNSISQSTLYCLPKITLIQIFDIYFRGIITSETAVRMGVLPVAYQQLFEVNKGVQSLTVTFKGTQRQLEWLEIL